MPVMSVSDARSRLPQVIESAKTEEVVLERHGRRAAVVVSPERYDELIEALEDGHDIAASDAALAEEGPNIPWEAAKADLGWQ